MKKMYRRALAVLLALIFLINIGAAPVEAASRRSALKKVSITKVSQALNADSGVTCTVKWKKVKGAKGYQISESYKESGDWYNTTSVTNSTSYKTGGSGISEIKIRVRAYKIVKKQKKYGPWSTVKKIKVNKSKIKAKSKVKTKTKKSSKKTKKTKKTKKK